MSAFEPGGKLGADSHMQRLEAGGLLACGECGHERVVDNEVLARFPIKDRSYLRELSDLRTFRCSKCGAKGSVRYIPLDELRLRQKSAEDVEQAMARKSCHHCRNTGRGPNGRQCSHCQGLSIDPNA